MQSLTKTAFFNEFYKQSVATKFDKIVRKSVRKMLTFTYIYNIFDNFTLNL